MIIYEMYFAMTLKLRVATMMDLINQVIDFIQV